MEADCFPKWGAPSGLSWRLRTCQSQSIWKTRAGRACESSGLEASVSAPLVLGAAPSSVLSGGHGTLQPHDPLLTPSFSVSLSVSLSLSLPFTHRERSYGRCPLVTPSQQVLYYHASSFFLFFPPCLLLLVSVWAECVCVCGAVQVWVPCNYPVYDQQKNEESLLCGQLMQTKTRLGRKRLQ